MYLIVEDDANCPSPKDLKLTDLPVSDNYLTSMDDMTSNGWSFSSNIETGNWQSVYDRCANDALIFWGKKEESGSVMAKFSGTGSATLDYGNCGLQGTVTVYLKNNVIHTAAKNSKDPKDPKNSFSNKIYFSFSPNDVLKLEDTDAGAIRIISLDLRCQGIPLDFLLILSNINHIAIMMNHIFPIFMVYSLHPLDYYKAPPGQNCPSDLIVATQEECEAAGKQLGDNIMPKHNPSKYRPAGCFSSYGDGGSAFNPTIDPSATALKNKNMFGGICKSKGKRHNFKQTHALNKAIC